MSVAVLIPAAGSGSRFGGDIPKQFRLLGGKPILQRVVERFLVHERVGHIVVAVAEMLIDEAMQTDRVRYVAGGATRQQSVSNALAGIGDEDLPSFRGHIVNDAIVVNGRSYGTEVTIVNRGPQLVQLMNG